MRIRWFLSTSFAVILPFAGTISAADNPDFTKTLPADQAPVAAADPAKGAPASTAKPKMFKGDKKVSRKFDTNAGNKPFMKRAKFGKKHGKAAKFDPQSADSQKISKPQVDKFAYRKSDSATQGMPVTPAGSNGEAVENGK